MAFGAVRAPGSGMSNRRKRRMERAAMGGQQPTLTNPTPQADITASPTDHGEQSGIDMVLSQLADQHHPVGGV